jgi:hypothetical protein
MAQEEFPLGFALAQLHGIYMLAQNAKGLVLVDMHAAHERILYEQLKNALDSRVAGEEMQVQPLLIPSPSMPTRWKWHRRRTSGNLQALGFDIAVLSPTTLAVRSVPVLLKNADAQTLARDVLRDVREFGGSRVLIERQNELLGTLACHTAVRANRILSLQEMNACCARWKSPSAPTSATMAARPGCRWKSARWTSSSCAANNHEHQTTGRRHHGPDGVGQDRLRAGDRRTHSVEIISVDSALVYRGMDIGTAKPTAKNWPPCRTT